MLSTKVFSSSTNAKNYYSHADYYGAEAKGSWFGKGAEELSLKGEFSAKSDKDFEKILQGKMPDGTRLGKRDRSGNINHRPGADLTFSSPKSFSIQMHIFANKEEKAKLEIARMNAIQKTLSYIEQSGLVYTRKGKGGVEKEEINKLVFALFSHTTNRRLEPQDHVHCLLANVSKCKDGKYRSIVWDNVLRNNKFIGQIFRNELALEVKKIGYDIRTTILSDGSSAFELKSVSQKLIDAFSTRRKEIVELCKKYGVTTKEGRDKIVINSRGSKKTVSEEVLKSTWKKVVESVEKEKPNTKSLTVERALDAVRDLLDKTIYHKHSKLDKTESKLELESLAKLSLDDITHHQSVFTEVEIARKALKYSIGKYSIKEVQLGIDNLIKEKEIIKSKTEGFTSKELLDKEKYILKVGKLGLNKCAAIIAKEKFTKRFRWHEKQVDRNYPLNKQQIKAIKHVLTSQDKITAIQGLPGVGKSTVLETVRLMSRRKILDLVGAAPTASAAKTLKESSGIESRTLHSFIGQYKGYLEGRGTKEGLVKSQNEYKKSIVFVDEASLIGTRQMYNLLKLSEILKFRVVPVGDTQQPSAVEAGKPFEQLLDIVKSIKMNKIVRQKEEVHKEAIKETANNNILKSFKIHENNIKDSGKHFANEAVKKYLSLTPRERDNTILISPTRKDRDGINKKIVEKLSKERVVRGPSVALNILKNADLTKSDYNFAPSYKEGNIVKFYKSYKSLGINKGENLEVNKINTFSNTLMFKKGLRNIRFQLKKDVDYGPKLEVFERSTLAVQEGVKLRITKNETGLINSETATVKNLDISKKTITLKLEDSSKRTFAFSDLKHIDYGYCSTVHSSQGKTTDRLIAAICDHKLLNTQKSWLVSISRHKHDLHIYTDDKRQIQKQFSTNKGTVISASDAVKGIKMLQKA
jgi:conjugative relaxase-like TrwC/TraI family protein